MDEVIKTIAWSAPLSALLVTVVFWLGRNLILERLKGSISFEYNRALESHKAELKAKFDTELEIQRAVLKAKLDTGLELQKAELKAKADFDLESLKALMQDRSHLAKAKFDMEFQGYQKLWTALATVVDASVRLARLYYSTEVSEDKKTKLTHAEDADNAFFKASAVCNELQPFITVDVYQDSLHLTAECKAEIDQFFQAVKLERRNDASYDQEEAGKEAQEATTRLLGQYRAIADSIRARLHSLTNAPVISTVGAKQGLQGGI